VEAGGLAGWGGDRGERVRGEGVQDGGGRVGGAGVRVDLLEDTVDVDVVGLARLAAVLLAFRPARAGLVLAVGARHVFELSLILSVFWEMLLNLKIGPLSL